MQGESVAMAAHPARVLITRYLQTGRRSPGKLVYSLHVIFAGLDLNCRALTIPNHESFKARGGGEMSRFVNTHGFIQHKKTPPPLMFLQIFIITDIL